MLVLKLGEMLKKTDMLTYFAVSALLMMRVLIRSSCPYRAAMCSGVFPFLSSQSISAPSGRETKHLAGVIPRSGSGS